ncbi:hypothetical protein, partial [Vibrio cyclitrophicus]|uniref:hypothetical protein n=1 Tax=Vibrio cyclitrophicus TaxID=47951 RepID=UPI0005173798
MQKPQRLYRLLLLATKRPTLANCNCKMRYRIPKKRTKRSNTHQIAIKQPFHAVLKVGTLPAMYI